MSSSVHPAKSACEKVVEKLNTLLADSYLLYVKTQNFHWNVEGGRFYQLHAFFEEQYTALSKGIDEIAEQLRALGVRPLSSMRQFLKESQLVESEGRLSEEEMLQALVEDHEAIISSLSSAIEAAHKARDEATADLFIQRLREHQKFSWMLKSHLR